MSNQRPYLVLFVLPVVAAYGCIGTNDLTEPDDRQVLRGSATIVVSTSGTNLDTDGYVVTLDEQNSSPIATNGSHTFRDLTARTYAATLDEVAPNCAVQESNPQTFTVMGGSNTDVAFRVVCS